MCTITQALRVADGIAVTHPLPDSVVVWASRHGVVIQGEMPDAPALAHALDLRFENSLHDGHLGRTFDTWRGVVQNIEVQLTNSRPTAAEAVA